MGDWLAGKRALVVGGGSGIGRAVVAAFVAEGAQVVVLDRDADKCASVGSEHPGVLAVVGDATSRSVNDEAVAAAEQEFGGLDTLVNCVGVFDFFRGIDDLGADVIDGAFDEIFAVNVKSYVHSVKAALPLLRVSGGSIILTESVSAYHPGKGGLLYVASKYAVRGLVMALAHELKPAVRVNGVAPGGTLHTDLRGPASLGLDGVRIEERMGTDDERAAASPLGIALSPADHAWAFLYLASDRARGVTGGVIHSDAGFAVRD